MRAAVQERKDLIVLVADGHQEQTVATLLTRRQPSLGIRQISIDIDSDIRPILIAIREYSMEQEVFWQILPDYINML